MKCEHTKPGESMIKCHGCVFVMCYFDLKIATHHRIRGAKFKHQERIKSIKAMMISPYSSNRLTIQFYTSFDSALDEQVFHLQCTLYYYKHDLCLEQSE